MLQSVIWAAYLPKIQVVFSISGTRIGKFIHMGVCRGENGNLTPWKLGLITTKPQVSSLIPTKLFNSCNNSLFAGMTLTLYTSQVYCSGVMQ